MIENAGHQEHLFLPLLAHFVSDFFFDFVVILVGWKLIIDYEMNGIAATKCVFY